MTAIAGTNVAAPVRPFDTADEFPTVLPDLSRVQQLFVDATVHF